jgi:PIN domain nuclease of toxin-antitoxin system
VLLWALADDRSLEAKARAEIVDPGNAVLVSAVSVWEISIKRTLGKLKAPGDLLRQIEMSGLEALPITLAHADTAGTLPRHHDDPFDRMLVAQAVSESLTLVTRDPRLADYRIPILSA